MRSIMEKVLRPDTHGLFEGAMIIFIGLAFRYLIGKSRVHELNECLMKYRSSIDREKYQT